MASNVASSSLCFLIRLASFLKYEPLASTVNAAHAGCAALAAATARFVSPMEASCTDTTVSPLCNHHAQEGQFLTLCDNFQTFWRDQIKRLWAVWWLLELSEIFISFSCVLDVGIWPDHWWRGESRLILMQLRSPYQLLSKLKAGYKLAWNLVGVIQLDRNSYLSPDLFPGSNVSRVSVRCNSEDQVGCETRPHPDLGRQPNTVNLPSLEIERCDSLIWFQNVPLPVNKNWKLDCYSPGVRVLPGALHLGSDPPYTRQQILDPLLFTKHIGSMKPTLVRCCMS